MTSYTLPREIKISLVVVLVFLAWVKFASANLEITEIMYAPETGADYEWVEIYNSGSDPVDLTDYRFFHGETTSAPLNLKNGDTAILAPSNYAIIAKSSSSYSWLDFSGMILSASTLSLPDSGDNTYIAISDPDKKIIDSVRYDPSLGGSKTSKTSLSKIDDIWQGSVPTPGRANTSSGSNTNDTEGSGSSDTTSTSESLVSTSSTSTQSATKKKTTEIPKISTDIVIKTTIFAGISFSVAANTLNYDKSTLILGTFVWNLGDGTSRIDNGYKPFNYAYDYPGQYVVTLSYYQNYYVGAVPDATDRVTVKVVTPEVSISSVGTEADPYIELENKSSYEMDMSGWTIKGSLHIFTFPIGAVLLPNQKLKLSPRVTSLTNFDITSLVLLNPSSVAMNTHSIAVQAPYIPTPSVSTTPKVSVKSTSSIPQVVKTQSVIDLNDLSANALGTQENSPEETPQPQSNAGYSFAGVVGVIAIGSSLTIFARRKLLKKSDSLEAEMSPEDIEIVE